MTYKPVGPFSLTYSQGGWVIADVEGVRMAELTGILIDGSGRKEPYPDGIIRSREQREAEAEFTHRAVNNHDTLLAALTQAETRLSLLVDRDQHKLLDVIARDSARAAILGATT